MIEKLEGIIINETPYGDTSKIINILTSEHGLVGVMCKGVKSLKNPLRTRTMKFTYGYFHLKYNENKLSHLLEVDVIDQLKNIKESIELISYLSYITELTYQVVKQNNDKMIFDIYKNAILKIDSGCNPLIITNIIELKYLEFLGVGLNLDSCIKCGNKTQIITLDPDEGGFICKNCYEQQKILSPKTIKLIRMYYLVELSSIKEINIKDENAREINYFLEKYYERYTGLYLKSKAFLKKISNLF